MAAVKILAIDPGTTHSGYVVYETETNTVPEFTDEIDNMELAAKIASPWLNDIAEFAVEYVKSYGMPVGDSVFRTQYFVGYFLAIFQIYSGNKPAHCFYRDTILAHHCGVVKAKDKNLKIVICERFNEPTHPKRPKGPLKGMKDHAWSALAVALTRADGRIGVNYYWEKEQCAD